VGKSSFGAPESTRTRVAECLSHYRRMLEKDRSTIAGKTKKEPCSCICEGGRHRVFPTGKKKCSVRSSHVPEGDCWGATCSAAKEGNRGEPPGIRGKGKKKFAPVGESLNLICSPPAPRSENRGVGLVASEKGGRKGVFLSRYFPIRARNSPQKKETSSSALPQKKIPQQKKKKKKKKKGG